MAVNDLETLALRLSRTRGNKAADDALRALLAADPALMREVAAHYAARGVSPRVD